MYLGNFAMYRCLRKPISITFSVMFVSAISIASAQNVASASILLINWKWNKNAYPWGLSLPKEGNNSINSQNEDNNEFNKLCNIIEHPFIISTRLIIVVIHFDEESNYDNNCINDWYHQYCHEI